MKNEKCGVHISIFPVKKTGSTWSYPFVFLNNMLCFK